VKNSQCTDYTALTVEWHKAIMQILKVIFKFYTEKPIETAELQPEGAAGGILAAGGLCYSLDHGFTKLSKNLEEISKCYCQKCNIKQTSYSGATLQNFVS